MCEMTSKDHLQAENEIIPPTNTEARNFDKTHVPGDMLPGGVLQFGRTDNSITVVCDCAPHDSDIGLMESTDSSINRTSIADLASKC